MVQPYDYSLNVPSPFEAFTSGIRIGQAGLEAQARRRQLEAQQAAAEQAAEQQKQVEGLLDEFYTAPSYDKAMRLSQYLPKDQYANLISGFESKTKQQQQNELLFGGQVMSALAGGKTETAVSLLNARAEALGDSPEAQSYRQAAELAQANPEGALGIVSTMMAVLPGSKDMIDRAFAAKAAPVEMRKREAEAALAELEAQYAPDRIQAELNLSDAQLEQAKAARAASIAAEKKSGAEAERAREAAARLAQGIIPEEKKPEQEGKLRKEYSDQTKGYQDVKAAYSRLLASQPTPAGDIALIFNYMKMLDPGSVVREGEFATAQNAGGIDSKIYNVYNSLLTGERLKPEQRKMFTSQAESLYSQAQKQEDIVRKGVERIARSYGLNVENIFYTPTEEPPEAPEMGQEPVTPGQAAAAPPLPTEAPAPSRFQFRGVRQ